MVTFYTHDNGGSPFKVVASSKFKRARIYRLVDWNPAVYETSPTMEVDHVRTVWIDPTLKGDYVGCALLLETDDNRVFFVGQCVMQLLLQPDEEMIKFRSPVWSNDVPMPYAITNKRTFLLAGAPVQVIPNILMDPDFQNPYDQIFNPLPAVAHTTGTPTAAEEELVAERNRAYAAAGDFWKQERFNGKHEVIKLLKPNDLYA